jgi:crotonobetaine/carnitine-CoA ligase
VLSFPEFRTVFPEAEWTLPRVLEQRAETIGDRPFLQWTDQNPPLSFAEVNARVNRIAHGLVALGLRKGDRLAILLPNCLDFVLTWFATAKIGVVEVPINTAYTGRFLDHQLRISGAQAVLVEGDLVPAVLAALPACPEVRHLIVHDGDLPATDGVAVSRFADLNGPESNPGIALAPQDLSSILFTSGTTGLSKGVMMPHAHFYLFSEMVIQMVRLTGEDTYVTGFPLFHGNAQFCTVYPSLIAGARCVLYEKFSASQWIHRLVASGATVTNSLGVTLAFVMNQPPSALDRRHKLKRIFAAPTPHGLLPAFRERFGNMEFHESFGQTEMNMPILCPPGVERPIGACGIAVDQYFEVKLVDPETDQEVPVGEVGELLVRHKAPWTLNTGYVNMPAETLTAWRNLWFHTGDGLRRDAEGWFYFVDRVKDSLRRRGENISSFEVEEPIREHPAIHEVAVIAVPAPGEAAEDEVMACIVLAEGEAMSADEVIAWCRDRIPAFAIPRYIEFMAALPKTPTERVQKNKLRQIGVTSATWDRMAHEGARG